MRWTWPVAIAAAVAVGLLLAGADSAYLHQFLPEPLRPSHRHDLVRLPGPPPSFVADGRPGLVYTGLGPVGGLFSFWWFVAAALGAFLVVVAAPIVAPVRTRRAAARVTPGALPLMLAAGVAAFLLVSAATVLLRATFFLVALTPLLWAVAAAGLVFGLGCLALAGGRVLRSRLGPAHPLVAAGLAALLILDVALIPVAGWLALGGVSLTALGVAAVTRFGSERGWNLEELNW